MNKISIIIPVYNAEKTIAKTIESLLAQTYSNIEIICIDDGSKDESLSILQQYKSTHSNSVTIVHQENRGLSATRNTGIDISTGDILMFVDADDELVPKACFDVNKIFEETGADVFTFGFRCIPEELTPLGMKKDQMPPNKTYTQYRSDLLFKDKARPYACRTAVKKSFLQTNNIRFDEQIQFGEDQVFFFLLYPLSRKTVLSSKQLYLYRMLPDSLTHKNGTDPKAEKFKLEQHRKIVESILNEWKIRGLDNLSRVELLEWILDFLLFDSNRLPLDEQKIFYSKLMQSLRSYYNEDLIKLAKSPLSRNCLKDINMIIEFEKTNSLRRNIHLGLFYLKRYGLFRCFQQVLISIGILKKWK